jgi:hypothetical protein
MAEREGLIRRDAPHPFGASHSVRRPAQRKALLVDPLVGFEPSLVSEAGYINAAKRVEFGQEYLIWRRERD